MRSPSRLASEPLQSLNGGVFAGRSPQKRHHLNQRAPKARGKARTHKPCERTEPYRNILCL
jgi:hypothetical protein